MKSGMGFNHLQKRNHLHRLTALLLCLVMAISLSYHILLDLGSLIVVAEQERPQAETREDIKARLMRQIREKGWDPYASDMSLDEFYALMELFEEGSLPLKTSKVATIADLVDASPTIPRDMFLFSGLKDADITVDEDKPLDYDNNTGVPAPDPDSGNYPAGLDPYGLGYQRPPVNWKGVDTTGMQAVIVKEGENDGNPNIAGNVVQNLFKPYNEYYVRRVTAESAEVTILGAIRLPGQEEYVYYYLTSDKQENDVSTTTLPKGQKFIIEYSPIEHVVNYEVYMDGLNGINVTDREETVNVNGKDITATWEEIIFGADRPGKTDGAAYSFTAWAPYGYTVEFYLLRAEEGEPTLEMGKDRPGNYRGVNNGWALGKEPVYSLKNEFTVYPDSNNGPEALTMSGTFYNNEVHHDRTVIAVVTENGTPTFDAATIINLSDGTKDRGACATRYVWATNAQTGEREYILYDYEDHYFAMRGLPSKYTNYENSYGSGNVSPAGDQWVWTNGNNRSVVDNVEMDRDDDGTYSFQWTFQTNSSEVYILDALQINGVSLRLPFLPKDAIDGFADGAASGTGLRSWYTESTLPDGATVRVELLCGFKEQRVYRIVVTGARSNVTVTGMNLMQSRGGAAEFVVYDLDGVTGATMRGNTNHTEAIQYYNKTGNWGSSNSTEGNVPESNLVVHEGDKALNFAGDTNLNHGANLRFKLADGYDSPYYLWENARGGTVISNQSSIQRNNDGSINYASQEPLKSFADLVPGEIMDSQHIYKGDDGWYYIRVTTQDSHKIALLTIIARPVRYVVRYVPSAGASNVPEPKNMPSFSHDEEHDSFLWENDNGINAWEYDTAGGAYYDAAVDDIIRLPTAVPTDPNSKYRFVDWVLVDRNYNPIWAWTSSDGNSVQVTTDQYGNRILVSPNADDKNIHHPALLVNGKLVIGENYEVHWNGTSYDLITDGAEQGVVPENWVTLTRDGQLAYAIDGSLVELSEALPDETDLTNLLVNWGVRDANGDAATINLTSQFRYRSNPITLLDVNQYAIPNEDLGGDETDIYVLRLIPNWEPITNPFNYRVALNWVDAQGNLHEEFFDRYWNDVLTDWKIEGSNYLTVQVIKGATPFLDWIAMHPTYNFWDGVNNNNALYRYYSDSENADADGNYDPAKAYEAMSKEMAAALEEYIPDLSQNSEQYEKVLEALCNRDISGRDGISGDPVTDNRGNGQDDFWRLGSYAYQVHEDYGTIVVWMYEDKGGLVFRKEVEPESYLPGEEFYFTVNHVTVGEGEELLNGTYKAYPITVYNEDGTVRDRIDRDAWTVTFENGNITKVVKNDGSDATSKCFILKSGEGIGLYVPSGTYSITETGSQSGQGYQTSVNYSSTDGRPPKTDWNLPENQPLEGNKQEVVNNEPGVSQVTATVKFELGERNVVQTLTFVNATLSLRIECQVQAPGGHDLWSKTFQYQLQFTLPDEVTPLYNAEGDYHYYNVIYYSKNGEVTSGTIQMTQTSGSTVSRIRNMAQTSGGNVWYGVLDSDGAAFTLNEGDSCVIILPAANGTISYISTESKPKDDDTWYLSGRDYERNGILAVGASATEVYLNTVTQTSLYITKRVIGTNGKADDGDPNEFTFTVTLSDTSYTDKNFKDGVFTFTLTAGKSIFLVLENLGVEDVEITYTVTETAIDGYTTTYTKGTGPLVLGEMNEVTVTNRRIKPTPGILVITEKGGDPNESFLYRIKGKDNDGNDIEIIVSVKGGGETYVYCPPGDYTIEEITDWAWRYEDGECEQAKTPPKSKVTVTVSGANDTLGSAAHADYTNERNDKVWFGDENSKDNHFNATSSGENDQEGTEDPVKLAHDLLAVYNGEKKKWDDAASESK